MIDLKDLDYVSAISKAGSLQNAARNIGLSQPALTKRIQNLENAFGLTLFDRLPTGLRLTEAGLDFLSAGEKLIAHARDFENMVSTRQKGAGGKVSFGIKPGMDDAFCRSSIIEFSECYPETTVSIDINTTPRLADQIKSGAIDFAMGALGYADEQGNELVLSPELTFDPLFKIPMEVFVRKNHPVLENLSDPYALFDYPAAGPTPPLQIFNDFKAAYEKRSKPIERLHIQVDDYGMVYDLVERSNMWSATFASSHRKLELSEKFELLGEFPILPPITVGLVKRKTWSMTPTAANLIDIMKKHAAKWLITD